MIVLGIFGFLLIIFLTTLLVIRMRFVNQQEKPESISHILKQAIRKNALLKSCVTVNNCFRIGLILMPRMEMTLTYGVKKEGGNMPGSKHIIMANKVF